MCPSNSEFNLQGFRSFHLYFERIWTMCLTSEMKRDNWNLEQQLTRIFRCALETWALKGSLSKLTYMCKVQALGYCSINKRLLNWKHKYYHYQIHMQQYYLQSTYKLWQYQNFKQNTHQPVVKCDVRRAEVKVAALNAHVLSQEERVGSSFK